MEISYFDYLHSELLCVIPVLWFIGWAIKRCHFIRDCLIPFLLMAVSILLCGIYLFATGPLDSTAQVLLCLFMSVTQGIIAAACAVFGNQIVKQGTQLFSPEKSDS